MTSVTNIPYSKIDASDAINARPDTKEGLDLNHLYPLQTLVYKPSALCAVPLPAPQIVPAGGTLAGPAAFVMLEQAILSGQLDARQVEAEFSADPQFRDWFQARATARQEAA